MGNAKDCTIPSRVIATCFALVGFAGSIVVGIAAGNDLTAILLRAMLVMVGCFAIGTVIGAVLQHTIDQHIEQHKRDNPIPGQPGSEASNPSDRPATSREGANTAA